MGMFSTRLVTYRDVLDDAAAHTDPLIRAAVTNDVPVPVLERAIEQAGQDYEEQLDAIHAEIQAAAVRNAAVLVLEGNFPEPEDGTCLLQIAASLGSPIITGSRLQQGDQDTPITEDAAWLLSILLRSGVLIPTTELDGWELRRCQAMVDVNTSHPELYLEWVPQPGNTGRKMYHVTIPARELHALSSQTGAALVTALVHLINRRALYGHPPRAAMG